MIDEEVVATKVQRSARVVFGGLCFQLVMYFILINDTVNRLAAQALSTSVSALILGHLQSTNRHRHRDVSECIIGSLL